MNQGRIPLKWKESKLKVLFKGKGERDNVNSYRGISIGNALFNLLDKMLYFRIFGNFMNVIPENQFGFIPKRCTLQAIEKLHVKIMDQKEKNYTWFLSTFLKPLTRWIENAFLKL